MEQETKIPEKLKEYSDFTYNSGSDSDFIASVRAEVKKRRVRRRTAYSVSAGLASIVLVFTVTFNNSGNGDLSSSLDQELMALVDNSKSSYTDLLTFDELDIVYDATDSMYEGEVDSVYNIFDDDESTDTIGELAQLDDAQLSIVFKQLSNESYL